MHDLMALSVEVSSVTAAGKQIKKPIEIPRPKSKKSAAAQRAARQQSATDAAYRKGIGVLAATSRAVQR